jgi:hypothetical protein
MAAEQRNLEAQFNLGVMYKEGRGIAQDRVRAHGGQACAIDDAREGDRRSGRFFQTEQCTDELPFHYPQLCLDIKQWAIELGAPKLPHQMGARHHALLDARWTRDAWAFLACHPHARLRTHSNLQTSQLMFQSGV